MFVILHTYTTNASKEIQRKREEAERIALVLAGDKKCLFHRFTVYRNPYLLDLQKRQERLLVYRPVSKCSMLTKST